MISKEIKNRFHPFMTDELKQDIIKDENHMQSRNRLTSVHKKGTKLKKGRKNSADNDEDTHSDGSDEENSHGHG